MIDTNSEEFKKQYPMYPIFKFLGERGKCIWCNKKMPLVTEVVGSKKDGHAGICINVKWLVHVQTTHGFDPEDVEMMINEVCFKKQ